MPLYEYQCTRCGVRFERLQKLSDPQVTECPTCGGPVEKLVSSPAFQFKGTGFYATDYGRKPESSEGSTNDGSKADASKAPSEKPAGETKADTKTETSKSESSTASEATSKPTTPPSKPT